MTIGVFVMHGRVQSAPTPTARSIGSIAVTNTTASATTTRASCSTNCCPKSKRRQTADGRAIRLSDERQRPRHRRLEQRRDLRVHGGVGTARRVHAACSARSAPMSACAAAIVTRRSSASTEPKPIRIFLQDGTNDLNIYGGDWWMANQNDGTRARLCRLRSQSTSGERAATTASTATQVFPDAMRWLWKDWPKPVGKGGGLAAVAGDSHPGRGVATGRGGYSSPKARPPTPKAKYSSPTFRTARRYKIGLDGKVSEFIADTKTANGQAFGPDGRLYAVASGEPKDSRLRRRRKSRP